MITICLLLAALTPGVPHVQVPKRPNLPAKLVIYHVDFTMTTTFPETVSSIRTEGVKTIITREQYMRQLFGVLTPTSRRGKPHPGFVRLLGVTDSGKVRFMVDDDGGARVDGKEFEMTPGGFLMLDRILSRIEEGDK